MKRIRIRRGLQVAAVGAAAVLAVAGVATAIRLGNDRLAPANHGMKVGPYTHWLYVVDSGYRHEKVLAVDADDGGEIKERFRAGTAPQMALSPDGRRVYVIADVEPAGVDSYGSVIDTFDTSTGARLARTSLPELDGATKARTGFKLPPYASDFVSSQDGSRLYLGENTARRGPVRRQPFVGTFDTSESSLLANSVEIRDCWSHVFLPGPAHDALTVVCSATSTHATVPTNFVYFLRISDDGSAVASRRLDLPPTGEGREEIAWAAASPDGQTIYAVTVDGRVFTIDVQGQRLEDTVDLGTWPNETIQLGKVVLSPDGNTLYLGTASAGEPSVVEADHIESFDVRDWAALESVDTDWFWSLSLGADGKQLFAPTFGRRSTVSAYIQVFDADTLTKRPPLTQIGTAPNLVEVPLLGR